MIGRRIANYSILERLGAGGMGVVYRARDEKLERDVAIKILSPALTENAEARERFLREARAASSLDHPNIGAIYAIEEGGDGELFLVMALYEGQPLDHAMRTRGFDEPAQREIARKLLSGLAAAHARGIVHRDIKPSNVFLTTDDELKILDFGLARVAGSELTRTDTSVGSPGYMSPEQARGVPVDARSDLWSFGVLLYELCTGDNPFHRESLAATIYAITQEEAQLDLPGGPLGELLSRCVQRDPERRAASANELLALLDATTASGAGDATQRIRLEATQQIARPRRSRHPMIWVGAATLLAVVLWMGLQLRPQSPPSSLAVLPPNWETATEDTEFLAANARDSILRALSQLPRVALLDPHEVATLGEDGVGRLHPDRMLRTTLADRGAEWSIRLELFETVPKQLIEHREFRVPKDDAWNSSLAIQSQVLGMFGSRSGDAFEYAVRGGDYARYLAARSLYWSLSDAAPRDSLLTDMEAVARNSPRFQPAMLLAAELAGELYYNTHDDAYFQRSRSLAEQAIAQWPHDAGPRIVLARAATYANDAELAGRQIEVLQREHAADPIWYFVAAEWEQLRGNPDAALDWMRQAARRMPTRRNRFELARLLNKQNGFDEARDVLRSLIADHPDYRFAHAKLAEIELLEGDPQVAVGLCSDLLADGLDVGNLVNRGLAYSLLQDYDAASADFHSALAFAPNHPYLLLNAADGELTAGRTEAARALYSKALASYEGKELASWRDELVVAQCQVHLGRAQDALRSAQNALSHAAGSADAYYMAAVVYCVAGERQSALLNARLALEAGQQPRWFGLPWFDPLRELPEFQQLFAQPQS